MTDKVASIIIPVAPEHVGVVGHALASAQAQTLPCEVLVIADDERRGAGWARNRGIEQARTDFVVFLDADDILMPNFVERCWALHLQTGRYVYTDWVDQHGKLYTAPECAWVADAWHAVTAFIPTAWARQVHGFDETLRLGGEDSEFFVHLCTEGHCGTRLPETLFVYTNTPDGRSKRWHASPERTAYNQMIEERYIRKGKTAMGCCTEPATPLGLLDAAAPNKVLARPKWGGNRRERGQVTGTVYEAADRSVVVEVDPRDAKARPDLWEILPPPAPVVQPVQAPVLSNLPPTPTLQTLARRSLQIPPEPPPPVIPPPPAQVAPALPDFDRIARVAGTFAPPRSNDGGWTVDETTSAEYQKSVYDLKPSDALDRISYLTKLGRQNNTFPLFVFPDTDYPSYTDVKRLVELSEFQAITMSQAQLRRQASDYPNYTFIILSPEQPSIEPLPGHAIWWALEYGGEYEPDLSNWHGEVWASDPAWAKAHNAKFVVMGSHPRLADAIRELVVNTKQYDYVQLAYQAPRRQRVDMQLAELSTPKNPYPGYGLERAEQLVNAKLMLHVHQHDTVAAIAPQRFALAAAYKLPLICESVPDAGAYAQYATFVDYQFLNAEVRSRLAMMDMGYPAEQGEQLHQWLCVEQTFRKSVEDALK
jgi:glycosyl transferase family 2